MFQWFKKKRLERKNRLQNRLKQEILELEEVLEHQVTLYDIKTKQYNDFMVEAEIKNKKWRTLLEEEKTSNGKLLQSYLKQINNLKEQNKELEKEVKELKSNNDLLRTTLGHF